MQVLSILTFGKEKGGFFPQVRCPLRAQQAVRALPPLGRCCARLRT